MRPSDEYLRLLDELLECRDDVSRNIVQNQLKNVVERESGGIAETLPLVERYKRSIVTFHIHGFLRFPASHGVHRREGINFCATVEHGDANGGKSTSESNPLHLSDPSSGEIQASVLVDVREVGKKAQTIVDTSHPIVRLNTLDECKRRIGNPRKRTGEFALGKRCFLSEFERLSPQGELTMLFPIGIDGRNERITLDQIECQIIQGRPHLINHLTSQKGNLNRRRCGNTQLLFAFRFVDDFVRISSGVSGFGSLDRLQVFLFPDEFKPGRSQSI